MGQGKAMFGVRQSRGLAVALVMVFGWFSVSMAFAQGQLPRPSVSATRPSGAGAPGNPANLSLPLPVPGAQDDSYRMGSGDKLRVVVYGEEDLGGEYLVAGDGSVQLPLLGQMRAAGLTVHEFQNMVGAKFVSEGYLKDPRVSVEVQNYRPFYIIGEVKSPGQYPFVSGMNVLNAVALAGGYTYRADERQLYVRRNGSQQEIKVPGDQTTRINPGDIIRVDERFF
jgi:polysaccharide export outer membrane protein